LPGRKPYALSTGGPMIVYSEPFAGNERIDENQIFMLGLDAPASEKTLLKNVSCQAEGVNEKIDVRIIQGSARRELLAQRASFNRNFARVYYRQQGVELQDIRADDPRLAQLPIVLLQCKRSLFPGTRVDLVWGAGVGTPDGIASDIEQSLSFRTRPEFNARFECERVSLQAQCIPFLPMTLRFSAPIRAADAQRIVLRGAAGHRFEPAAPAAGTEFVESITFRGPFPEQARFSLELPADLRDDAQRKLTNQPSFPLAVATDAMPPLAKFAAPFGIVEAGEAAALPVTLRNVEAQVETRIAALPGQTLRVGPGQDALVMDWYYRLQRAGRTQWGASQEETVYPGEQSLFKTAELADATAVQRFELPKPGGAAPFEVVGIPLPKPGFYVVELASPRLGAALNRKQTPMYVAAGALVTNLSVHFKRGTESSLVWVTALDSAQPVKGAEVVVRDCAGRALWQGKTAVGGIARIAQALPKVRCDERGDDYFISARHGDDMAFALSSWSGGIQPWRFNIPSGGYDGDTNILVHTVFDRTLLMANDTVHMKHFRRAHTQAGLALPKDDATPGKLSIRHVGSDQTFELPLAWSKNGRGVTTSRSVVARRAHSRSRLSACRRCARCCRGPPLPRSSRGRSRSMCSSITWRAEQPHMRRSSCAVRSKSACSRFRCMRIMSSPMDCFFTTMAPQRAARSRAMKWRAAARR
jgi:hypothetical protein